MFKTTTCIDFPCLDTYLPDILDALEAHQLPVRRGALNQLIVGAEGEIALTVRPERLDITIQCQDRMMLNRLRYAVTSLIDFNAREVEPRIVWQGDTIGSTIPPDLQPLTVVATEYVTPRMRRIWFTGDDLARYDTLHQLHCRLLFRRGRGKPEVWPLMTDTGRIRWPEGAEKLDTRIYTVRSVDIGVGRLAVDFYLDDHGGPATNWARGAEPGDVVGFIGPAAQGPVIAQFQVFAGDETGLPGIARCLEALGANTRGVALIEVNGVEDEVPITAPPGVEIRWLYRRGAQPGTSRVLVEEFERICWPDNLERCSFWCGCEYRAFRELRQKARDLGLRSGQMVVFAHWRAGMSEPDIAAAGSRAIRD